MPKLRIPSEANTAAWFFLSPALVLIGIFFFLPVAASLLLSVTDFDIYGVADPTATRFVGLKNYSHLLSTPDFWNALKNTLYFAFVGGPLTIAVALGAALLLNSKLVRFKGLFRTIYFTPFVTTLVAVAIVWRYLYHTQYGLFNFVLGKFGISPIDWLGDPHWAMPAIILMAVWKSFGYNMLIFIAGLQAIPEELYDAAEIDGASTSAAVLQHYAANACPDAGVRRRCHDDRLLPAVRRAVRDDAGWSVAEHRRALCC